MTVWFTSDTHYGHANIIAYSKRPFDDSKNMTESMVSNWNSIVERGDLVCHLGDFSLGDEEEAVKIARRLNGQKYLVFGNHDKSLRKNNDFFSQWIWAKDMAEIYVGEQKIILCHYAFRVWNQSHRGSWNLHGHSHGSLPNDPNRLQLDVGVDCWDYYPVSFEGLQKRMALKNNVPVDHHGKRGTLPDGSPI